MLFSSRRVLLCCVLALAGCKSVASNLIADALSGPGTLGRDDDVQLVRDAAPFGLKTMESVLESSPQHEGLLTALASGYAQYGYAFVQQDADALEFAGKISDATAVRTRAKKLCLRARDYGLRGLEVSNPGISEKLKSIRDLPAAVASLKSEQLPLIYWTAAAWALAISNGKEDLGLVAELPAPGALLDRALALDADWNKGALAEFAVSYENARPGGTAAKAKSYYDRSLTLSKGAHLGVFVSWAEGVLVAEQKRAEFEKMLNEVLSSDVKKSPDDTLANTVAQNRARLLLKYADDLFN
jgi:TRAP transporter T-component